ncbi:MAG TPA: hypothetical protein VNQ55_03905, partial [Parapedobacter sp.]|nr:hypothetical protein [Parapedobacter sp.]
MEKHQCNAIALFGAVVLSILTMSSCGTGNSQQNIGNSSDTTGYTQLFDGSSLAGWRGDTSLW